MASTRYMLDTNIASCILRGPSPKLASRLASVPMAQLCVSSVTEGELLFGAARTPASVGLRTAVRGFLLRVDSLAWDSPAARSYATLRTLLEARGTPLGNLDTLIAAHALSVSAVLVSNDRTFALVPGLALENWL